MVVAPIFTDRERFPVKLMQMGKRTLSPQQGRISVLEGREVRLGGGHCGEETSLTISNADFQEFLDDISECFLSREVSVWRDRMILPFSIITRDGPVVMETEEAVSTNFNNYLAACDLMSLNMISRRPISLEDCADGTWLGTFETRLVANGLLATDPYTATALLSRVDNVVRMSSMLNGRGHHEWTGLPINN